MKYRVSVEFRPEPLTYEVEVEARNQDRAEQEAALLLRSQPDYLGGDGSYQFEVEQLTVDCGECGNEFPAEQIKDDLCPACYDAAEPVSAKLPVKAFDVDSFLANLTEALQVIGGAK